MCGRFARFRADADLARIFEIDEIIASVRASWNVAPTQRVLGVTERFADDGGGCRRELRAFRWGLVPSWAKDPSMGARLINARVETVVDKPSFRSAALKRRIIVPMDGYYEWQKPGVAGGAKTPFYLTDPSGSVLAAAGLSEFWRDPAREPDDPEAWLATCTIITTAATDTLGHIHDRTPLLLPPDLWSPWLDPGLTSKPDVAALLASVPPPVLTPIQVGPAVGNIRNNGPDLITPVEPAELF